MTIRVFHTARSLWASQGSGATAKAGTERRRRTAQRLFKKRLGRAGVQGRVAFLVEGHICVGAIRTIQAANAGVERANTNMTDRKSTRLNSSHTVISYAVFRLKKNTEKAREKTEYNDNH